MNDDDNGDNESGGRVGGLVGIFISKGGWFSGACLSGWGLVAGYFDIKNNQASSINSDVAYFFLGLAIIGMSMKQKHSSDMLVRSEAEKRIQDPGLTTASKDPAIQKEIDKQLAEPPPTVPPADVLNAIDRKTPLVGTLIPPKG